MSKSLQIVAFDNPNPPNYGGAVEMFYKIQALHHLGLEIDLHFFAYGNRREIGSLREICSNVYIYERKMNLGSLFSDLPFIVKTRAVKTLLNNLSKNKAPILFEGLHSCFYLKHPKLQNHFKVVRTHNIEHEYYLGLYKNSRNTFKKIYYRSESSKLKAFESVLSNANLIISLTKKDAKHFEQYGTTVWIPAFYEDVTFNVPKGDYILFHGNLSVEENISAVLNLIENVFNRVIHPIIIAGKLPHNAIGKAIEVFNNISLIPNPCEKEMKELINKAKCHVFYTDQNTGIKLKLVHAIKTRGHIIMNDAMLFDKEFENEIEITDDWKSMIKRIDYCMNSEHIKPRPRLRALFNNHHNAQLLEKFIFNN